MVLQHNTLTAADVQPFSPSVFQFDGVIMKNVQQLTTLTKKTSYIFEKALETSLH